MRSGSKGFVAGFNGGCVWHYILGKYSMEQAFSLASFF